MPEEVDRVHPISYTFDYLRGRDDSKAPTECDKWIYKLDYGYHSMTSDVRLEKISSTVEAILSYELSFFLNIYNSARLGVRFGLEINTGTIAIFHWIRNWVIVFRCLGRSDRSIASLGHFKSDGYGW